MKQTINPESVEPIRYYKVGRFIVDVEDQQVSELNGVPIALPGETYQLLDVLVRASPEVISVAELMGGGSFDDQLNEDHIHQQMALLRQALSVGQDDEAYVHAKPDGGYSITAQPVRPKVKRRSVPKYLLPFMLFLVVVTPLVAFLLGS